jgi:hypothetical protein
VLPTLEHGAVLVLIGGIALHPRRHVPIGQLHRALVAAAGLLRDELAHEERALLQHIQERRAVRQPIRITEMTQPDRTLVDRECTRL